MIGSGILSLDSLSLLLVWSAIATYLLAFASYALDLAVRSGGRGERYGADGVLVSAGVVRPDGEAMSATPVKIAEPPIRRLGVWGRIGTTLTALALTLHVAATIGRGVAAERVPWANMYEFALTGTTLIVAVYLLVARRYNLHFLGSFLTGMVVLLLGGATIGFYVEITPLMDPLKSVWLIIHVFVASLATALFAIACGLSATQILQNRRERRLAVAGRTEQRSDASYLRTLPTADALESVAYRFSIVGFIFWTFTLIAGSIWANDSWGRYWGFDTKEVWTLVIWILYAGYIHARATRGWRGNRSAWLSIIGFAAVLFNFTIVNMFFKGLHAYSGLTT